MMENKLGNFTDILSDEIPESQPMSLTSIFDNNLQGTQECSQQTTQIKPLKHTGQYGEFRSVEEIDPKYRGFFTYPFFNLVQSRVIEDALYSDKSMVVCAPTGSGKTVVFEMAIVQLLMEIDDKNYDRDFKIIYMAPVKALCTERLTEWYSKFTKLGLLCIEVTGDTDVDFNNLKPYRVIITTPEKWDMMTRRWRDHRGLVELIKLFLIDEVHILNDDTRGPVLEAVVSRMKTIESSTQSEYRIEQLQKQYQTDQENAISVDVPPPRIRFVAVSATVSNPEDVAAWLGTSDKPAVYYKFGDECRPVKLKRVVEGYPCPDGTSIFKFDIILNYKLWPIIQKYHDGKPTLIFCNTRKSVTLTAEALSREITISFNPEQRAKLTALSATIKNKKLQALVLAGVGCHHAGLLFEERLNIENAFRNRDLPILITTTTLAMGVNLPAHLVIIKNTQQYVKGAYQEYSMSTVLQMVGRAGRPQFDTDATAVIMTRASDKHRYEALVCGSEPLQSYLHKRLPENLNSEAALGTVNDVAQCVQWLRSTFLYVRAAKDPKRYLGLPNNAPQHLISKKIEELCVRAMNGLASAGLITMDEASCIESTEAGRLMSIYYLDLETMKHIMKIEGTATLEQVLWVVCESHELADMHLRVDERRSLNALNRNTAAATIRFPMKGKICTRQMKLNCVIQAVLGCLPILDPSINQEAMKIMRIADRVCKCLVAYVTRPDLISRQPTFFSAVLNSLILSKCLAAHLWENSPYVSKQLKGIGPTFSTLLATAGKINFMLLEESHPRDLERIMNKGPPAGNVLRKQISLLPKYQITMTPIDENVVTMELTLLNHNYLSENMDNLTAGERHKSYIIAGDSENRLLLLTSFQDKDLIGMYDGRLSREIKRIHNFEHKINVHCISTKFVGLDAHCEYIFKDLHTVPMGNELNSCYFVKDTINKKTTHKQTCTTDIYKERKRRNKCESLEGKSKEKKKRETVLAEKIRVLKESFGKTTKDVKKELQKSSELSNKIVCDILNVNGNIPVEPSDKLIHESNKTTSNTIGLYSCHTNNKNVNDSLEVFANNNFVCDEYIDDSKIDDILKDIESEICKEGKSTNSSEKILYKRSNIDKINIFKRPESKIQIKKPKKTNFNFMELLDRNVDYQEKEDVNPITDTGFSNTIKLHINKYLEETRSSTKTSNSLIENIIINEDMDHMEEDNNDEFLPMVKLNPNEQPNLDVNYSKINVIERPNCNITNKNDKKTESVKNYEFIETLPIDKSVICLQTETKSGDVILNKDCHKNIALEDKTSGNSNDLNNNVMAHTDYKNRCDDSTMLEIQNTSHHEIYFPQVIDNVERSVVSLHKNNHSSLSKNSDDKYQDTEKYSGFKEINKTDSKANYIKKYKFSAMNVDIRVSTRHLEDRHVHVIKKMKLDVDVTEIVTNKDIKMETPTDFVNVSSPLTNTTQSSHKTVSINYLDGCKAIENNDTNCNNNLETDKSLTFPISLKKLEPNQYTDLCVLQSKDNRIQNIRKPLLVANKSMYAVYSDVPKLDKEIVDLQKPMDFDIDAKTNDTELNTHVHNAGKPSLGHQLVSYYQGNTTCVDKFNRYEVKNNDTNLNVKANKPYNYSPNQGNSVLEDENTIQVKKQVLAEKKTSAIDELVADDKQPILDFTRKSAENALGNILEKYSTIIRKNKNEDDRIGSSKVSQSKNFILKNERHKRPFKITDINEVNQKLPSLLINESLKYTPNQMPTATDSQKNSTTPQSPLIARIKNGNKVVTQIPIIETHKEPLIEQNIDPIPDEELDLLPTTDKDSFTSNYNIDDSMFNPKTLLQCLTNDEPEIIPPPLEFSDLNYSPHHETKVYNIQTHELVYPVPDNEDKVFYNDNAKHADYKDFGNNQFIYDSSNEIETLMLSNEECSERNPWIITKSSVIRNRPGEDSYTSSRPRLNNFKFTGKKKLKMK